MSDRSYIPVVLGNGEVGMLQYWQAAGKVCFALIIADHGHIEFKTEPEFAGGLSNGVMLCETEARLERKRAQ